MIPGHVVFEVDVRKVCRLKYRSLQASFIGEPVVFDLGVVAGVGRQEAEAVFPGTFQGRDDEGRRVSLP